MAKVKIIIGGEGLRFTVPNQDLNQLVDAIADETQYQEELPNPDFDPDADPPVPTIPNPETKKQWVARQAFDWLWQSFERLSASSVSASAEQIDRTAKQGTRDAITEEPDAAPE